MEFQKHDKDDKIRFELVEAEYTEGLAKILTFGAKKYAAFNWQKASSEEDKLRIRGALERHLNAYFRGEKLDPETGLSHLYHANCNMMFLDYFDRLEDLALDNVVKSTPLSDDFYERVELHYPQCEVVGWVSDINNNITYTIMNNRTGTLYEKVENEQDLADRADNEI